MKSYITDRKIINLSRRFRVRRWMRESGCVWAAITIVAAVLITVELVINH